MARVPCIQVDAFTNTPFKGNPAAVCLLEGAYDDAWMQAVAAEMNLSETAFIHRRDDDGFDLRWFTPAIEVDLCGHATLASAHVLWEEGIVEGGDAIRFHTRSGTLVCARNEDLIELDFPSTPPTETDLPVELFTALGIEAAWQGRSCFDALVLVESEEVLRSLEPDFQRLRSIPVRGIIVTSVADAPDIDFVSRFFGPAAGIDEDPVTGSAHCCLAPFWSERLDKLEMSAYQASPRGGLVRVRVDGDRVILGGHAVTVLRGELFDHPGAL